MSSERTLDLSTSTPPTPFHADQTSTTLLVSDRPFTDADPVLLDIYLTSVVYSDKFARPDPYSFSRAELFHSDVTYEVQTPGTTILKLYVTPEVGNDTLWSSG